MLISHMPEDEGRDTRRVGGDYSGGDNNHEYKTASELFDMMARSHNFQPNEDETLTAQDLVLLYKNIDLGTKLMTTANELKRNTPNQFVETIVYEDFESDSELSEIYSSDDIRNVVMINKEQLDLLSPPPREHGICKKFGEVGRHRLDRSTDFDKRLIFKDPFFNDKIKGINLVSSDDGANLPGSLLDYICCKRLEDNYNIYMDNIITHVKHTIEHLKRISNGDFLTDKAKKKWKEVDSCAQLDNIDTNTKVLANTTSIPLYIEQKTSGHLTKWDDLMHSSVDVRSLSKVLEKKIVVEVPKIIGSFKLLTKCRNDNLVICCKKETPVILKPEVKEPRVNVILKLNRSESGHIMSKINSVMILNNNTSEIVNEPLSLSYKSSEDAGSISINSKKEKIRLVEVHDRDGASNHSSSCSKTVDHPAGSVPAQVQNEKYQQDEDEHLTTSSVNYPDPYSNDFFETNSLEEITEAPVLSEATSRHTKRLSSLPEESCDDSNAYLSMNKKKNTPTRIKSPYENKTYYLEEKKRKRLLEIRQRREKKKMAWTESCKINKLKYTKGVMSPQTVSSVTKLSITNKSFYNSIYGQTACESIERKSRIRGRRDKRQLIRLPTDTFEVDEEFKNKDEYINIRKYVNKSYYLDDAVTEMFIKMKKEKCSAPISREPPLKTDFRVDWKVLSQVTKPSITDHVDSIKTATDSIEVFENEIREVADFDDFIGNSPSKHSIREIRSGDEEGDVKPNTSVEFRKDIDRIYKLMKNLGKSDRSENKVKSKFTTITETSHMDGENSLVQCTDSGSSIKHHTSTNASSHSLKGSSQDEYLKPEKPATVKGASSANVVPKVIINTKYQVRKDIDKNKPIKGGNVAKPPENPLKAISHLLQEFNNVQMIRNKTIKPPEAPVVELKTNTGINPKPPIKRPARSDNRLRDNELHADKTKAKEKKSKSPVHRVTTPTAEHPKNIHSANFIDDKTGNKLLKKKVVDIVNEMKEARGEAVRGPPRSNNSRLNSLAQPKRTYIQAQIEEFQTRFGRSVVTDRLQKLTGASSPGAHSRVPSPEDKNSKNKRRTSVEPIHKPMAPPMLEKNLKKQYGNRSDVVPSTIPCTDQTFKQKGLDTREQLKKKMVAVESYVKHHYGAPWSNYTADKHGQKPRTPIAPKNYALSMTNSSSSSLGDSMMADGKNRQNIKTMVAKTSISPINEIENQETDVDFETNLNSDIKLVGCKYSDCHGHSAANKRESIIGDTIPEECDPPPSEVAPSDKDSVMELENNLCNLISTGKFNKRLRLEKLTLAPKDELRRVLFLQSGDANSSLFHELLSVKTCSDTNLKTHLDWAFSSFPMQISTVGYNFPHYNILHVEKREITDNGISTESCSSGQCNQNGNSSKNKQLEHETQIDFKDFASISKGNFTTQTITEESETLTDVSAIEMKNTVTINSSDDSSELESSFTNVPDTTDPEPFKRNNCDGGGHQEFSDNEQKIEIVNTPENKPDCYRQLIETVNIEKVKPTEMVMSDRKSSLSVVKSNDDNCLRAESCIDYTTSLDILVGLLNEIQKITTRQTQITATIDNRDGKELTVIKSAKVLEVQSKAPNIMPMSSKSSIYSVYLEEREFLERQLTDFNRLHPLCADKAVLAISSERELVNKCTEVPSQYSPISISHATSTSNTLVGILSEPSSQSVYAFQEQPSWDNASSLTAIKKITKLPKDETSETIFDDKAKQVYQATKKGFVQTAKKCFEDEVKDFRKGTKKNLGQAEKESFNELAIERHDMQEKKVFKTTSVKRVDELQKKKQVKITKKYMPGISGEESRQQLQKFKRSVGNKYYVHSESIIKIKRDLLVTMYSFLVLTVFAALSFPEIIGQT